MPFNLGLVKPTLEQLSRSIFMTYSVVSWCHSRCGDMIVAVNGLSTAGMSHSALVPMLKEQRSRVALTVVSWPGSLV